MLGLIRCWFKGAIVLLLASGLLLSTSWADYSRYSKTCDYHRGHYHCSSYYSESHHHRHHRHYPNRHYHGGSGDNVAGAAVAGLLVGGVIGALATSHPAPPPPVCTYKRVMVSRHKFWRHGKEYEKIGWATRRVCR